MSEAEGEGQGGPHRRTIRSFVTRAGRISNAQQRALDLLLPVWGVPYQGTPLALERVFGRDAPTVLEIGFGMGETTAAIARDHPELNFLGAEVHTPGIGALLKSIEQDALSNIRIVVHDAVEVLRFMLSPGSLTGIHLFFPDPWPKARHHKRRLVQPAFAALAAASLAPGGYLHCATDWEPYAEQMLAVLSTELLLENTSHDYASRINPLVARPKTKFEARGLKLGHQVRDLIFVRRTEVRAALNRAVPA